MDAATVTNEIAKPPSPAPFLEVAADAVTVCWKCRGSGTKVVKETKAVAPAAPTVTSDAAVATTTSTAVEGVAAPTERKLISVTCPICQGTGAFGRKRGRPEDARVRPVKEFPGFNLVGPEAAGPGADPTLCTQPGEDLCFLVGHWRIFQRRETHRYSTDDVVTAWVAWRAGQLLRLPEGAAPRCLDIGCGIGSVLLMTAWLHPHAVCKGVEAQPTRAAQAERSVRYNGAPSRVHVVCGDLRDPSNTTEGAQYDLITGTPPYFDVKHGAFPGSEESSRCLFEYRGGIEEYCATAARLLKPEGIFVVCESAFGTERGYAAAAAAGLRVLGRVDAIPKDGKPPLFVVFVMCLQAASHKCELDVTTAGSGASAGVSPEEGSTEPSDMLQFGASLFVPHGRSPYGSPYTPAAAEDGLAAPSVGGSPSSTSNTAMASRPAKRTRIAPSREGDASDVVAAVGAGEEEPSRSLAAKVGTAAHASTADTNSTMPPPPPPRFVHHVVVRDAAAERTPEYRLLLAEMGKPG